MSTLLRSVVVTGPKVGDDWLWRFDADLVWNRFPDTGDYQLVDHVPALRGLGTQVPADVQVAGDGEDIHAAPLFRARLDFENAREIRVRGPKTSGPDFDGEVAPNGDDHADVLLTPTEPWPRPGGGNIRVPDVRLAAGRITMRVPLLDKKKAVNGLAKFLHYNPGKHTVFEGHKLVGDDAGKGQGPLVHLVPNGIEVDVRLPHPFVDISPNTEKPPATIDARVRIEPAGTKQFIARLVEVLDEDANAPSLTERFQKAFNRLEDEKAPLRAQADSRSEVPPLWWKLYLNASGLHVRAEDKTVKWRLGIDPSLFALRIETDHPFGSDVPAVARLGDLEEAEQSDLTLRKERAATFLEYRSRIADFSMVNPPEVTATYTRDGNKYELATLDVSPLDVYLPIGEAGARRAVSDEVPDWAFLPVRDGTLQIPAAPFVTAEQASAPPAKSSLIGNSVFRQDHMALNIDGAEAVGLTVRWYQGNAQNITLGFRSPDGALREALWSAEEAPTSDRLLPTGRTDPGHLRELPARFGHGTPRNASLELMALGSWTLTLNGATREELGVIHWAAVKGLPLIPAVPMLASTAESRPSDMRAVVPVERRGLVKLQSDGKGALANVDVPIKTEVSGNWPWVEPAELPGWGVPSVSFVSPTAPGLDYAWLKGVQPDRNGFQVSLRYDLSILDELYAQADPEAEADAETGRDSPPPPAPVTGVLDLDQMAKLWSDRAFALATTRTQGARATEWVEHDVSTNGPIALAAPYDAEATVTFKRDYELADGETLPLGGYLLSWDEALFSGERALLGPMGEESEECNEVTPLDLVLTSLDGGLHPAQAEEVAEDDEDEVGDLDTEADDEVDVLEEPILALQLAGFAPSAYVDTSLGNKDPTSLSDTRGTAMARPSIIAGVAFRPSRFRYRDDTDALQADDRLLVTFDGSLAVAGLGKDVHFWVRDLPLTENGTFDGTENPVERRLGPDPTPFGANALQDALYEWRLFQVPEDGKSAEYSFRHNGLTLTPLRLLEFSAAQIRVLCRASLEGVFKDARAGEVFGEETPYRVGPLLELKILVQPDNDNRITLSLAPQARVLLLKEDAKLRLSLTDADPDTLTFALSPALTLNIAGASQEVDDHVGLRADAVLQAMNKTPVLSLVTVTFPLFGEDVTLSMEADPNHPNPRFEFEFDDASPSDGVWIASASLEQVAQGPEGWQLNVTLKAQARIAQDAERRPHALRTTGGAVRWLGFTGSEAPTIAIDHTRGAIWIDQTTDGLSATSSPIEGINLEAGANWRFSAALVTGDKAEQAPIWAIASGLIQARLDGESGGLDIALTSHTRLTGATADTSLLLSRDVPVGQAPRYQQSGISWDLDGLTVEESDLAEAATLKTKNAAPMRHEISVSLQEVPVPVSALKIKEDADTVHLTHSVPMQLLVRHQLFNDDGERAAAWHSFDMVQLTSEQLWIIDWIGHTFGPRYKSDRAKYRGGEKELDHPGLGDRSTMLTGFDDPLILNAEREEEVAEGGDDTRLILIGGSTGIFTHEDTAHVFGLPWVVGMETGEPGLPEVFSDLMTFGAEAQWSAAADDANLFTVDPDALPPVVQVPVSAVGKAELDAVLATKPVIPDPVNADFWPSLQAFVQRDPGGDPVGDVRTWPLFLPPLVALKSMLETIDGKDRESWRILTVYHRGEQSAVALSLPHVDLATRPSAPDRFAGVHLVALDRQGPPRFFGVDLPPDITDIRTAQDQLGPPRLADLAEAQITGAVAVGLAELRRRTEPDPVRGSDDDDLLVGAVRNLAIKPEDAPFGRKQAELFDHRQQVYPSPALGWPETVDAHGAARFAMDGRADQPVVSKTAGLAGRSAVLSSGAAVAPNPGQARYLMTQARVAYDHGDRFDTATLRAPPARHLSVLPPRLRTPVPSAREDALRKLSAEVTAPPPEGGAEENQHSRDGATPILDDTMGIIPAIHSRSYIGERPGVHETFIDAVVTDGPRSDPIDRGARGAGRSAALSPVLARQLRTPRSPALPADPKFDLTKRRRTYVSIFDRETADGPALPMAVRNGAATLWRLGDDERFILELDTASLLPGDVETSQTTGAPFQLKLILWHRGNSSVLDALAKSGFLNKRVEDDVATAELRAWLALGDTRVDAFRLDWDKSQEVDTPGGTDTKMAFDLSFAGRDLGPVLSALADPNPNAQATLQISFVKPGTPKPFAASEFSAPLVQGKNTALLKGEPTALSFPIGRTPARRPTLEIQRRSFLFADPAFDRVLACPGASSQLLRNADGSLAVVLAADRTQYALTQTLFLAYGALNDGAFTDKNVNASLDLKLIPKRGDEAPSQPVKLRLAGEENTPELTDFQVYGLPLGLLEPTEAGQPRPQPGDQLVIEVKPNNGFNEASMRLVVPLAERADDPRPAAVYSVIALGTSQADEPGAVRTLMHAAAPAPDRVQFVDLLGDLASGHIRKRAIFEWRTTDLKNTEDWARFALTKTDRSGGAQMPKVAADLLTAPKTED